VVLARLGPLHPLPRNAPVRADDVLQHLNGDWLVDGRQSDHVGDELAHGDLLLAIGRKVLPVAAHGRVQLEQAPRVLQGGGEARDSLGG